MPSRTDIVVVTKSEGEMDPTVEDKYSYQSLNVNTAKLIFHFIFRGEGQRKNLESLIINIWS